MPIAIDRTHDHKLTSWVTSANSPDTDFPIQNLPLGVFAPTGPGERQGEPTVGVAIGDRVLDLVALADAGLLDTVGDDLGEIFDWWSLNRFMWEGPEVWSRLRTRLSELLREDNAELRDHPDLRKAALYKQSEVEMIEPIEIGDYTDFYASIHHATNVGSMFRPDNPLLPNYKWVPIGYHGRASSIVVSGTPVTRPNGQTKADDADAPKFGPSRLLDYEMEVGAIVGLPNELGHPVPIERAEDHLFGLVLVNDWSARDLQKWEYQPLGPFLAKNFCTTVSPWVVSMHALAPFRGPAMKRPEGDPQPLPYLTSDHDQKHGGINLTLEVFIRSEQMRERQMDPVRLSKGSFLDMYWTVAQLLTHHASNGCNLQPGDMFASGTVSGTAKDSRGSMLELTWRGTEPITLPTGEERKFLADGDEVIMRGSCEREGYRRIGFGECSGIIQPAP